MAEPRLTPQHLAAPRKLILLVRINSQGDYEAVTLAGEIALVGKSRDEIKEKMRLQVRQMKASVRPTTVRLHFIAEQRTWLHASPHAEEGAADKTAANSAHTTTQPADTHLAPRNGSGPSQESATFKTNDTSQKSKSTKK